MKKELARFFGDRRLVITTLLLPGIMIYVVYSFLGSVMMKTMLPDDTYVVWWYFRRILIQWWKTTRSVVGNLRPM